MTLEEIVERACGMGLEAVALTDVNNMYGAVAFQRLARERGIKAVVGAELRTRSQRATLLARDREGYANLCRAITRLHLGKGDCAPGDDAVTRGEAPGQGSGVGDDAPGADWAGCHSRGIGSHGKGARHCEAPPGADSPLWEILDGQTVGLHCIVEDPSVAERLANLFPRERLWLELATPGRPPESWERAVRAARSLGAGMVATGEAWFGAAEDWTLHRTLRAVAGRTLVQRAGAGEGVAHPNSYMATPAQMVRRLGRFSWALGRSAELAGDCDLTLESGGHIFPACELPPGETPRSKLTEMCRGGLRARFGPSPSQRALRRLDRELDVIDALGFCPYFIVVGEIVAWARGRGISVIGRGSGASSLVAYLLGITGVDPLRYGLVFERFMNSRRRDYPDLDLDLCWRRRDEVIDHVYETYGRDRVAMISTHVTFQRRSALREMARAWGLPPDEVLKTEREWNRARERGEDPGEGALQSEGREESPLRDDASPGRGGPAGRVAGRGVLSKEPLRTVLATARRVRGFPRHIGIHCGGLVIAPDPLAGSVPLQRAPKGVVVTQYEMDAVESLGLVKMDLLGNRGLTVAQDCLELAGARAGGAGERRSPGDARALLGNRRRRVPANLEEIPDGDPVTAKLLAAGDTLGCFQMESPAMRQLLTMIKARNSDEVIAAVALVRPGPSGSGMKETFIRRKRGLEKTRYTHPCLAPVLKETHGVMLYEEDVLKVAAFVAGLSLEDGDDLRRALLEARSGEEVGEVRRGFTDAVKRRGVSPEGADALWADLARFSSYAFCKAHAAGYGLLAYRTAYLKAHYPVEYAMAVLNNHGGMYPTRVHLEDARRRGIDVLGPCVNKSAAEFTIEGNAIRVGLNRVKGLRSAAVADILRAREDEGGPFKSLSDLLFRVRLAASEAEGLVLAGALDFTGAPRPALLLEVLVWSRRGGGAREGRSRSRAGGGGEGPLFGGTGLPSGACKTSDFDAELRLEMEGRHLGLTPSRHPVEAREGRRAATEEAKGSERALVACGALKERLGGRVDVLGVVSAARRIRTERGEPMLFLTIEDSTGLVEAVVFPEAYRRMTVDPYGGEPLLVTGTVEDHYGALTLVVQDVRPARAGSSRDREEADAAGPCSPWGGG